MTEPIVPLIAAFPLYDGVTLMDFVGPTDVFTGTGGFIKPIWLAEEKRAIQTSEGMTVFPNYSFRDTYPAIDILFVPGGHAPDLINNAMFNNTYQNFIKQTAVTAQWSGSVCVGAFIIAAAGLLNNCRATTYWSQLNNLSVLSEKYNLTIPPGFPRAVIDTANKRFTGGGIASSIDLALKLVEQIKGKFMAESAQLFVQYAPDPPVNSGDPSQAPNAVYESLLISEAGFTKLFYEAAERLIGE